MLTRRHYNNGNAEFILEPVNEAVVKVTHRDQVGWIGISLDWDAERPYTSTTISSQLRDAGISGLGLHHDTPDAALRFLCGTLLNQQSKVDSQRINPEERKAAAKRVLREFLNELPE